MKGEGNADWKAGLVAGKSFAGATFTGTGGHRAAVHNGRLEAAPTSGGGTLPVPARIGNPGYPPDEELLSAD